jgi:hypothetical protein
LGQIAEAVARHQTEIAERRFGLIDRPGVAPVDEAIPSGRLARRHTDSLQTLFVEQRAHQLQEVHHLRAMPIPVVIVLRVATPTAVGRPAPKILALVVQRNVFDRKLLFVAQILDPRDHVFGLFGLQRRVEIAPAIAPAHELLFGHPGARAAERCDDG